MGVVSRDAESSERSAGYARAPLRRLRVAANHGCDTQRDTRGDAMSHAAAKLALEDGTVYTGRHFGGPGETFGEVVFNTSMTGYQEVLTDPSYKGQIVTMTYPLIGNYGVNAEDRNRAGRRSKASSSASWPQAEQLPLAPDASTPTCGEPRHRPGRHRHPRPGPPPARPRRHERRPLDHRSRRRRAGAQGPQLPGIVGRDLVRRSCRSSRFAGRRASTRRLPRRRVHAGRAGITSSPSTSA